MSETATVPQFTAPATKRRRQRSPSPPAPRKKSCEACRKAKARCSETLPRCSRCEKKGVACNYDGTRNEELNGPPLQSFDVDLAKLIGENIDGDAGLSSHVMDALASTDMLAVAGMGYSNTATQAGVFAPGHYSPDASAGSSNGDSDGSGFGYQSSMTSLGDSPESMRTDPYLVPTASKKASDWDPNVLPFTLRAQYRDDGTKEIEILPNMTSTEYNARFEGFNVDFTPDSSFSGNRVIGAFKVWPTLMVKGTVLPPFIHPHFPTLRVSESTSIAAQAHVMARGNALPKLPENLANCSSICTMFYNKTPENAPFVWKNIKREQERIYANYRDSSLENICTSFQAMLTYAFLRLIDGEHEHNNFDMAFVLTITELGTALWSDRLRALQTRKADPRQINWSDWILAESTCRTGMVFQFMIIMLQIYKALPPTPGCKGIDDVPLPSGRRIWQARSYSEWLHEYKSYQANRKSSRVLRFGDLKTLRRDTDNYLSPAEKEDLDNWTSDLDDFGNLVLVAGLAGPNSMLADYRISHLGIPA